MAKISFKVTGMTCAACSAAVERGLRDLAGTSEISVNLATGRTVVEYDPEVLSLRKYSILLNRRATAYHPEMMTPKRKRGPSGSCETT